MKFAVIIFIVVLLAIGLFYSGLISLQKNPEPMPQPSTNPQTLSDDPKYQEIKEKYNLDEEQLQILSTVNPNDNN